MAAALLSPANPHGSRYVTGLFPHKIVEKNPPDGISGRERLYRHIAQQPIPPLVASLGANAVFGAQRTKVLRRNACIASSIR
jgi:hypothetical protein